MLLFAGYFDESTDENAGAACYTVAGYIGALDAALQLDLRWRDLLRKYDLSYYKASEIENGWGEFKKHRESPKGPLTERDRALQRQIKNEFIDLICEDDSLSGISASVSIPAWNKILALEPELGAKLPKNLYTLCSQVVLMEAGLTMVDHNAKVRSAWRGQLKPIFDSHYNYESMFRQAFHEFRVKNPKSSRYLLEPEYESDKAYLCLQAADLLCFEVRRSLANYFANTESPVTEGMGRLLAKHAKMYALDYETLEILAKNQSEDKLPVKPIHLDPTNRPTRKALLK